MIFNVLLVSGWLATGFLSVRLDTIRVESRFGVGCYQGASTIITILSGPVGLAATLAMGGRQFGAALGLKPYSDAPAPNISRQRDVLSRVVLAGTKKPEYNHKHTHEYLITKTIRAEANKFHHAVKLPFLIDRQP